MEGNDQTTSTTTASSGSAPGSVTLLIENPGKGKNWGPLLRCCAAFGIGTIFVVGYDRCDVRGSHGASKHVQLRAFPTHEQAVKALRSATTNSNDDKDDVNGNNGFELIGLLAPYPNRDNDLDDDANNDDNEMRVIRETFLHEPTETQVEVVRTAPLSALSSEGKDDGNNDTKPPSKENFSTSFPVHSLEKYPGRVCLVVDKLKRGLPWSLAQHCSSFVHIPHANYASASAYQPTRNAGGSGGSGGGGGGSMLTLEASVSIVFHELLSCGNRSGYTEEKEESPGSSGATPSSVSDYQGQKYHVEKIHKGGNPNDAQARERKRKEREDKLRELRDDADDEECLLKQQQLLFGAGNDPGADGDY